MKILNPYKLLPRRYFKGNNPFNIWKKEQKIHLNKTLKKKSIKQWQKSKNLNFKFKKPKI
ncbi:hypothetical protein CCUN_0079 [Campylobacter cuniculorum DSM 23162 = LMG 24588]|uniref:Uncharacterized protein n=1 Tax=Campylobacter cuniculorum DSM 23162 = LMG 24588 TaxID=1121267 RepID=A0A1W6BUK5_9BACT|nr:hypothetical protein CCUN_0079 [Campylobacter cuniculorum DSM 23162 = LMG 24588]